jgi:cystathionine beta-lyase
VDPYEFFLKHAKVALNCGLDFGQEGNGFVRLNYATPRSMLAEALERIKAALAK